MLWRYTSCKRALSQGMRKIHIMTFFYVLPTITTSPLGFYIWIRKKPNVIQYHLLKTVITKIESFLKVSQGKENCTTGTFSAVYIKYSFQIGQQRNKTRWVLEAKKRHSRKLKRKGGGDQKWDSKTRQYSCRNSLVERPSLKGYATALQS